MKITFRFISVILCAVLLGTFLSGCMFLGSGNDSSREVFEPAYLENYYVNKHTPVCVSGHMDVYKYTENSDPFTISGHDYNGGFVFGTSYGPVELGCVDLPLDGLYKNISFVIGGDYSQKSVSRTVDGKPQYYSSLFAMNGAYPTIIGDASEVAVGLQFLVDGKVIDEIRLSNYDVATRYTYAVDGAEKFTFKIVTEGDVASGIPVFELTVWEDEAHETGYVPEAAGNEAVKLVRDLKPYMIPVSSSAEYYPNYASSERDYINMSSEKYTDAIATLVSIALIGIEEESIFFDLEGKYNYLTFDAGAADRTTNADEGSAWLTVTADGKMIFEEVFSTHELPRTVELDVTGCRQLKFSWSIDDGNEVIADSTGCVFGIGNAYVATTKEALDNIGEGGTDFPDRPVKMISELGAFGVYSNVDEAVFDGSTQFKTFSMGGIKYNEGVMMLSSNNMLYDDKPSCVSFNIGGKYNTVSFIAGHIANSDVYKEEKLEIYADGVLVKEILIACTMLPQEYTVDVTGCNHLEFVSGRVNAKSMWRPAIGIANLVAYPDGYVETDLFAKKTAGDFPQTGDLIETFGFYDVHNPHMDIEVGKVDVEDGYYDGSTNKNTFSVGDKTYNKGVLLHTSVHLSLDSDSIDSLAGFSLAGFTILALAAADVVHESAFAMANIRDSGYTKVTFTVAMQAENTAATADDTTVLKIGADNECIKEITLKKDMKPTTYTVNIGDCERLMFWLNCGTEDDASHTYAVYDITLEK